MHSSSLDPFFQCKFILGLVFTPQVTCHQLPSFLPPISLPGSPGPPTSGYRHAGAAIAISEGILYVTPASFEEVWDEESTGYKTCGQKKNTIYIYIYTRMYICTCMHI